MPTLKSSEIWQATLTVLRPQFWSLFAIAAPFTLLVDMVVSLFGPEPPKTVAEFTPKAALLLIALPGVIGAIAQLAVAHMIACPDEAPRRALAAGLAVLPAYLGAVALSAIPTGLAFLLLIIPGLYITARLFLIVPAAVLERGNSVAIIKRSWEMTKPVGWTILLFLVLAILFLLGISVLASGVGAALASVLTLMGLKSVGAFVAALVTAVVTTVFSIASAAASTVIYLKLR
nr:glycerophosphoryl diester phosphodiesterase membrane domain-containing protein [Polymorphobacter sp.]